MALDKATLATSIASAFATAHGAGSPSTAETTLANSIADAIDVYVGVHKHPITSGSSAPGPTGPPT